jgi:hypothetical protein
MPHKSERAEIIENLENQILGSIISNVLNDINTIADSFDNSNNNTSSKSDDEAPDNFVLYGLLQSQRYFKNRIHKRPDSSHLANDILQMPSELFRIKFRMSLLAFEHIWKMIANHRAFFNNSISPQFDPRLHFLIVLYRFGAYGNGASRANVASVFQISRGIIGKFTRWV